MNRHRRFFTFLILLPIIRAGDLASLAGAPSDALKMAANNEVCLGVASLGKKLREFEKNVFAEVAKSDSERVKAVENAKTEKERQSISRRESEKFMRWYDDVENEFNDTFLPEIKRYREELLRRLQRQEPLPRSLWAVYLGSLGPYRLSETASYLENMARMLCT